MPIMAPMEMTSPMMIQSMAMGSFWATGRFPIIASSINHPIAEAKTHHEATEDTKVHKEKQRNGGHRTRRRAPESQAR